MRVSDPLPREMRKVYGVCCKLAILPMEENGSQSFLESFKKITYIINQYKISRYQKINKTYFGVFQYGGAKQRVMKSVATTNKEFV
jgi:uncharacterized protein YqhQ